MSEVDVAKTFYDLIQYPLITEKAVTNVEAKSKVTLIVDPKATKGKVKRVLEDYFDVRVEKVNILTTPKGDKKAVVTLKSTDEAVKIAIALGVI